MKTKSAPSSTQPGSEPARSAQPLPVRHVAEVEPQCPERQWLVDQLWLDAGVGTLCGHPKLGKTFMAAELSMAVASGSLALGRYQARSSGPVLFYGAEDQLAALRSRFEGLAAVRGLALAELPIYLLDVPALRLDRQDDLLRLRATIEAGRPRLLVLDPFVRMVRLDENSAQDVSAVLGSLRAIQRDYELAVLLVHHARKAPAAHPGQALRGSGDFAAWSDSSLYLSRRARHLTLCIEHRSAPAPEPLELTLATDPAAHLALLAGSSRDDDCGEQPDPLQAAIIEQLSATRRPLPTVELRQLLRRRKADVVGALEQLHARGRVERDSHGWTLTDSAAASSPACSGVPTTGSRNSGTPQPT